MIAQKCPLHTLVEGNPSVSLRLTAPFTQGSRGYCHIGANGKTPDQSPSQEPIYSYFANTFSRIAMNPSISSLVMISGGTKRST